ncbi:MAG: flagellar hook capping protein [Nitrospirae bacterium]|nr:flagellar hook capping protein [Nitrospirota bacterium]
MIYSVNKLDTYTNDGEKKVVKKTLGKDDFLRLLVTQMQFQDPLKPMEQTEFTAQLAQFSSLDQLFGINDRLTTLTDTEGNFNNMQSVNFIGKEVKASGNKVYIGEGAPSATIGYSLNNDVSEVTIRIFGKDGKGVRTIEIGPQTAGSHNAAWDGRDEKGGMMAPGEYTFSVDAKDTLGKELKVLTNVVGVVTGVSFEDGAPYLMVNGIRVPVMHITEVRERR